VTPRSRLRALAPAAWPVLLVLATAWVARYLHVRAFGLYEDDLTIIPRAVAMSGPQVLAHVGDYIVNLYGHGRPLSDSLIYLGSWLGWRLGGLVSIYVLGFMVFGLNCILVYLLARRVAGQQVALLSGLAFAVFPADTTQAFLTHSLGLQPALTLALLALHACLPGRDWLSWILAALVLFTYETPFGLIAVGPLLAPGPWDRTRARRVILHGVVLAVILVSALGLRVAISDDRVARIPFPSIVLIPLERMAIGPLVGLGLFGLRIFSASGITTLGGWIATGGALAVLSGVLLLISPAHGLSPDDLGSLRQGSPRAGGSRRSWRERWGARTERLRQYVRTSGAALLMVILAYPLTYTVRAYAIDGRDTRVHFAAAAGGALLAGLAAGAVWDGLRHGGRRRLGAILIAVWLALLVGFGQVIQQDYRRGWASQQRFWSFLVTQIPDVRAGTVVLVEPQPLGDVTQIDANTWNLPRVLEQLYEFPEEWSTPPRVIRLQPDWRNHILSGEGPLSLSWLSVLSPESLWGEVEGKDVILFLDEGGVLVRQSGPMDIAGQMTSLMTTAARGEPRYAHGLLYDLMILPGEVE
jgi:hypothetical protein